MTRVDSARLPLLVLPREIARRVSVSDRAAPPIVALNGVICLEHEPADPLLIARDSSRHATNGKIPRSLSRRVISDLARSPIAVRSRFLFRPAAAAGEQPVYLHVPAEPVVCVRAHVSRKSPKFFRRFRSQIHFAMQRTPQLSPWRMHQWPMAACTLYLSPF